MCDKMRPGEIFETYKYYDYESVFIVGVLCDNMEANHCGHDVSHQIGTRTERWGHIIDIEVRRCDVCGQQFERRV